MFPFYFLQHRGEEHLVPQNVVIPFLNKDPGKAAGQGGVNQDWKPRCAPKGIFSQDVKRPPWKCIFF